MELELGKPCPWCGGFVNDAPGIGLYCVNEGGKCTMPAPFFVGPGLGAMAEFEAPRHMRKGQALVAFLAWVAKWRDPFYVDDDQLAKWWDEWVMSLDGDAE